MIFLFSPAKTQTCTKSTMPPTMPLFIKEANFINQNLKALSLAEKQNIFKLNDKLLIKTNASINNNKFDINGCCALYFYDGLQFKSARLSQLDNSSNHKYIINHVFILSALYGILRASDAIYSYRLDFNNQFKINHLSLYSFWIDHLNSFLSNNVTDDHLIINLASQEYGKMINRQKLSKDIRVIDVEFKIYKNNTWISQSTQTKQARGYFLTFIIENKVSDIKQLLAFNYDGYQYNATLSDPQFITFTKE